MRIDEKNGKDNRQKETGEKGMKIKWSSVRTRSIQKRVVRNQFTSTEALR